MQIHELTQKKPRVDEAFADVVRGVSSGLSRVAYAAASPKRGLSDIKSAWQQGKVAAQAQKLADQSQAAWNRYVQNWEATMDPDEKAKFATRKQDGGLYKRQLTAWVQKNMLSGLPLSSVTNRSEILAVIDDLSEPRQIPPVKEADQISAGGIAIPAGAKTASAPSRAAPNKPTGTPGLTDDEEKRMWLKLAQEVGRAQQAAYTGEPEVPAGAGAAASGATTTSAQEPQTDMSGDIKAALSQAGQDKNIGAISQIILGAAQTKSVRSTGNPAVDGFLRNLGFTLS